MLLFHNLTILLSDNLTILQFHHWTILGLDYVKYRSLHVFYVLKYYRLKQHKNLYGITSNIRDAILFDFI